MVVGQSASASSRRTLLAAVTLPLPPSVNNYWESQVVWSEKHQRHMSLRYVSTEGKAYQKLLRERFLELKAWYRSANPLELKVLVCPKSANRQDISNRVKVFEDCLKNGFVIEDDSQIETLEVRRGPQVTGGCVIVNLREILPDRQGNLAWIRPPPDL